MIEYALILLISCPGSGCQVHTIPGFNSQHTCVAGGNTVLLAMPEWRNWVKTICVAKSDKPQ